MTTKQGILFWPGYILAIGITLFALRPAKQAERTYERERGRREIAKAQEYDVGLMRSSVEHTLYSDQPVMTIWGGSLEREPQHPVDCERMRERVEDQILMVQKVCYESRLTEKYSFINDKEWGAWIPQLQNFASEYEQQCVSKFGAKAHTEYYAHLERNSIHHSNPEQEWCAKQESSIFQLWLLGGLGGWGLWIMFLAYTAKCVNGFTWKQLMKEWRIPLLALLGPITAVRFILAKPIEKIVFWTKIAAAATWAAMKVVAVASKAAAKIIAVRAQALAYGVASILACVIGVGAAHAQTNSTSSTGSKTGYAFIDERTINDKPVASSTSNWGGSLDLRFIQVDNGDQTAAIRLTVVRKSSGLLFETIGNERHTTKNRSQSIESYPGFALFRKNGLTINGIAGGKFIRTTNLKTDQVAEHFRLLFGAQAFGNWGKWKLEAPVNRIEVPLNTPKERKLFAHVSQLLYRIHPRVQIGEEVVLLKPNKLPWQKTIGFMARIKLSAKAFLEFGWFAQPDFAQPALVRSGARTRGSMVW